jgi:hypothetical protein
MREYYRNVLNNLYIWCGTNQVEKMTDEAITMLLNALENVSKVYSYIPEEKQKEIIDKCLISDKEYRNINARQVSKWLEENGKHYFQQECHQQTEIVAEPLTGEAREKRLAEWQKALLNIDTSFTQPVKGSGSKLREQMDRVAPIKQEHSALDEHCKQQAEETKPE